MPHISEDEMRTTEVRDEFAQREDVLRLRLKVGEAKLFDIAGTKGEVRLVSVKRTMYGWGGCGNYLGTGIRARFMFIGDKKSVEELDISPAPHLWAAGPLTLALGEADEKEGFATIILGRK